MERRDFNLKIKSIDDAGKFVGIGAVYNNVDLGGDLIEPGAFTRTLSAGKKWPVLWQHQVDNPMALPHDHRQSRGIAGRRHLGAF